MNVLRPGDVRGSATGRRRRPLVLMLVFLAFALTVCLYLSRLEAHTRTDIFLPIDYHSIAEINGAMANASAHSTADADALAYALNAYYEGYARQQARPYTIRQEILLSRLSYVKAPPGYRGEAEVSVGDLCDELRRLLRDPTLDAGRVLGRSRREILDIATGIDEHGLLRDLTIREYVATASGLAGYVLEGDRDITMALRGTDDAIDMLDNALLLPFNVSVQYAPMRRLLEKYGDASRIWLTGHSKGGHNAIYAASIDSRCRATGFNAPGFGIFLSDSQHDGLDLGVNYVINGDVTGFLLFHLERRIVLELIPAAPNGPSLNGRHRLDNFFSVDDLTVSVKIQPLSVWAEWITQIFWLSLLFLAGYGAIASLNAICRAMLTAKPGKPSDKPAAGNN